MSVNCKCNKILQKSAFFNEKYGKLGGLFGRVLMELHRVINFTVSKTIYEPSFGSFNDQTKQWSGVIGLIVDGKADIGVAEFTITNPRLNVVDFTLPLIPSRSLLYIKQSDGSTVQWSGYFKVYNNFYKKKYSLLLFYLFINNL